MQMTQECCRKSGGEPISAAFDGFSFFPFFLFPEPEEEAAGKGNVVVLKSILIVLSSCSKTEPA